MFFLLVPPAGVWLLSVSVLRFGSRFCLEGRKVDALPALYSYPQLDSRCHQTRPTRLALRAVGGSGLVVWFGGSWFRVHWTSWFRVHGSSWFRVHGFGGCQAVCFGRLDVVVEPAMGAA